MKEMFFQGGNFIQFSDLVWIEFNSLILVWGEYCLSLSLKFEERKRQTFLTWKFGWKSFALFYFVWEWMRFCHKFIATFGLNNVVIVGVIALLVLLVLVILSFKTNDNWFIHASICILPTGQLYRNIYIYIYIYIYENQCEKYHTTLTLLFELNIEILL